LSTPPPGLALAHKHGLTVLLNGDKLRIATSVQPPEMILDALRADKGAILDYLQHALAVTNPAAVPPLLVAEHWRQNFARLEAKADPCPGWHAGEWHNVHRVVSAFLDPAASPSWALHAARLQWSTLELFSVHRTVGAARFDTLGALLAGTHGEPVTQVVETLLRFRNGLASPRMPMDPERCVAIWDYQQPEAAAEKGAS
jgi:hypothetical protein